MKKKLFLILFTCLSLISCNNDEHGMFADVLTEADAFVASEKHQEYQLVQNKDRKQMNAILKSFSKQQQKQYKKFLYLAVQADSKNEQDLYVDNLSQLTGIDYRKRITRLYNVQKKAFEGINIKKSDYLKAVQRYNARVASKRVTRSVSTEEACLRSCEHMYYVALADCQYENELNSNCNDNPTFFGYTACTLSAETQYDSCVSSCN